MFSKQTMALAAAVSTAQAVYSGFNYASGLDYVTEFTNAKNLVGTNSEFVSARLYTSIESGTTDTPSSAFSAAIDLDVTLLLGVWGSGGQDFVDNEIAAITAAITTYGTDFTSRVAGISVGSEDLYRDSVTGIEADAGVGADPATIVDYIAQVRAAIAGTDLSGALVGHVDTWTAWVNGSNDAVITASDFIGMDAYPYFQNTEDNSISEGYDLFFSAYDQTVAVADGKEVWITETGWPTAGPTEGDAVASLANAKTYWDAVACKLLGNYNTYWYTLNDEGSSPTFGVSDGSDTPLYDLSCSATTSSSSSSSVASSTTSSSASATAAVSSTATETSASASVSASVSASASTAASQTIVSVSSSAAPTQIGGSPADSSSASIDASTSSFATASASAYSSVVASASSAASAASAESTASLPATIVSITGYTATGAVPTTLVSGTVVASSNGTLSYTATGSPSSTTSGLVASYTGGASHLQSTGGVILAMVAALAVL